MPLFLQYIFMTYRNSIGDIVAPAYNNWNNIFDDNVTSEYASKNVMIVFIWFLWLVN